MTAARRARPRPGDVVRITDVDGRAALAQFTHKHPMFGAVLRVLGPDTRSTEEADADAIAARPTQFIALFPLGSACSRGYAAIIGPAQIPAEHRAFPLFRAALPGGRAGDNWWLWDGEREWRVGRLTGDQRALPIREILNDTLLVERAHAGRRADHDGRV